MGKKKENIPEKYYQDSYIEQTTNKRTGSVMEKASLEKKDLLIFGGIFVVLIHAVFLLIRYLWCFVYLDRVILWNNPLYLGVMAVAPFFLWLYSTLSPFFSYYNRKIYFMTLCVSNALLTIMQPMYSLLWRIIVKNVMTMTPNAAMTELMILNLARMLMIASVAFCFIVIIRLISPLCFSKEAIEKVKRYKLSDTIDTRRQKDNRYDLTIMKNVKTGADMTVYEKDRFLHLLVNGTTGTGKTSSVYLPSVNNDLKVKAKNMELRQSEMLKMVLKEELTISDEFTKPDSFKETYLEATDDSAKKKLEELYNKYPDCGMTLIAPNSGHISKVIELAKANGNIKVNVLDPAATYSDKYDNALDIGLNPFYVPFGLDEEERAVIIKDKAQAFSEVLVAVNEMSAKSDVYFRDINTSVTTNIAIIVMLYKNLIGEQAYVTDIQRCINNFQELTEYVAYIEREKFEKGVTVDVPANPQKQGGISGAISKEQLLAAEEKNKVANEEESESLEEDLSDEIKTDNTVDGKWKDASESPYYLMILFVKSELLGAGAKDMYPQSRGLRNLINKFLMNPRILRILTAKDESRLDFDDMLSDNQITVVNTALEYGSASSTGFGLFFILLFKLSVLRRPGTEDTRSAHFIYIDEATQYMSPCYEDFVMLFRQYRVGSIFAVQSLNQFSKTDASKYIGGIMQSLGTQIVYGRVSAEEMKIYSELAGKEEVTMAQVTTSYASLLDENGKMGFSERTTPTKEAILEGEEIRYRDFQEATVYTVRDGKVLRAEIAKFNFVPKKEFTATKKYKLVDWNQFLKEEEQAIDLSDISDTALDVMAETASELSSGVSSWVTDSEMIAPDTDMFLSALQNIDFGDDEEE